MGKNFLFPLFILLAFLQAQQEFGKITLPLGRVEVSSSGSDEWNKAKVKQKVYSGDLIRTHAKSRAEITLVGGGKMRIGENSELKLGESNVKPMNKQFSANLQKGRVWTSVKAAFGETKEVTVKVPTAVAAIRGTKYRAEAGEDESSILVYDGKVDVNWSENVKKQQLEEKEGKGGGKPKFKLGPVQEIDAPTEVAGPYEVTLEEWITLVEGMQINIRKDGKYHMFKFDQDTDSEHDWVKWNRELDKQ
tara:strand:+ start:3385 stop:4128 length:744 start_codon:yes stop_codon:yes gene_type:complete